MSDEALREALERMRVFAEHDTHCIFALDLSGVNGDEWQGAHARRCSCGFDEALTLYDAALAEAAPPSPEWETFDDVDGHKSIRRAAPPSRALDALLSELAVVGDEHADLCGRAYIAIRRLSPTAEPAE